MSMPPPETPESVSYPALPHYPTTAIILWRFKNLVIVMAVVTVILAVLPIPSVVPVIVVLAIPVFIMVIAVKVIDWRGDAFFIRYLGALKANRRDPEYLQELGRRSNESVLTGPKRGLLLVGLMGAVFVIGLVFAAAAAGISEGLYN